MSQVVHITLEPSGLDPVDGIPTQQPWIHPHLVQSNDPIKGRQFRATGLIPKGARLLVDHPYAIIPVVDDPVHSDHLLCSSPACNCPVPRNLDRGSCPNACIADVVWCSSTCRDADRPRHEFECTWLKRFSGPIRAKRGEYDFGMLWVIVRLLATRQSELRHAPTIEKIPSASRWKLGWDAINSLCGSSDTWSHDQVRSWTVLVKKYLQSSPVLPHGLSTARILQLICQEEANSFGLYPRETGIFPLPNPPIDRGEQFAAAVYPTAAIANHSCLPNVSLRCLSFSGSPAHPNQMIHKPNDGGRMVFTASRHILPGEECCISYFDLTRFVDVASRREHLRKSFRFVCQCERCISEEPSEENIEWNAMPLMDL
ncbi:hypothetical protein N7492_008926 [Penicillium capsulatum]|uniref:SET domain-containing protein n=1 Tax=Penicillium capsulatum TaxID=69766 RepID=A0A9W9HT25_9EURO|nr:hypothetical protein N7492_008926 [Penicillium capsulatum]KAJ6106326.1 hypothetical protein N7512_009843 [Penicillium capsulatum]